MAGIAQIRDGSVNTLVQREVSLAHDGLNQIKQDPTRYLASPASAASKFVDAALSRFGVSPDFRALLPFVRDPVDAINRQIADPAPAVPPVSTNGTTGNDGLVTNGKDTIDTGR